MKKAQATIYVIAGIVILIAASLGYVLKTKVLTSDWERERARSLAVPEYAKKVQIFTQSCVEQVAKEGTSLLSAQGGYIDIPQDAFPYSPINPFSNRLQLFAQGESKIAYWFYESANGVSKNQIPTLEMIKIQLQQYMNEHLNTCLVNFDALKNQGYGIVESQPQTSIDITDEKIFITVRMPTAIEFEDQSTMIEGWYAVLEYQLGKMLKQAYNIMETENEKTFLEQYALDVLSIYDGIPFSGIDTECTPRTWKRTDVLSTIKNALATNIPLIKMEGTDFTLSQDFNKYFVVSADEVYVDTTTQFLYSPQWPMLVDILDEDGPLLEGKPYTIGNAASRFLAQFFCLNHYHFVYDMKFPVLITITDENNNMFQFATLVIIDNNQPRQNTLAIPAFGEESPICENPTIPLTISIGALSPSGDIVQLPGASVSLKCLTTQCPLGTTDQTGKLEARAPSCYNAALVVEKTGYHHDKHILSTNEEASVSSLVEPIYALDVEVQVIDNNNIRPLQPTEQAIFTFEEKNREYITSVVSPGNEKVSLIAGEYEITSQLVVNSDPPFTIPAQSVKVCHDAPREGALGIIGLQEKKCVTQQFDQVQLSQIASGGSKIPWQVLRPSLASANSITLYVVRSPAPQSIQDIENVERSLQQNAQKTREPTLE